MERLDAKASFQITSGISLIRNPSDNKKNEYFPRELVFDLVKDNFTDDRNLDVHLFNKFGNFLRSINISFPLINDYILEKTGQFLGLSPIYSDLEGVSRGRHCMALI